MFKNILGVAFFTGMRAGEILALKWKDINFENKSITIETQRTRGYTKKPKTKSSIRTIDMISQCEVFLKEQRKLTGLGEYIFLNTKNKIFYGSGDLQYKWYDVLRRLKLEKRGIHQTRHTFASNMLSNMENPLWVSQMLGHKSLVITLNTYTKYIKKDRNAKTTFLDDMNLQFCTNLAQ